MTEKPFEPLLHRELHIDDARRHFPRQLAMLRDMINYGTNMIPACMVSSERQLGDVIAITVLFKQVVMMFDAYEVLVAQACTESSVLQSRAILEASLYLDWIIREDKETRALYYYVSNIRRERQWVSRGIEDDEEQRRFFANLGEFAAAMEPTRKKLAEMAPERLREIDDFLSKAPFAQINESFLKARSERPYEVAWHEPLGERSVRSIAKTLGRLHEYEVFYSLASEVMHASRLSPHVKIGKGQIKLEPIRHLEGLGSAMRYTVGLIITTYRKLLEHYRPGQLGEFGARYVNEWRDAFMTIPQVHYSGTEGGALI